MSSPERPSKLTASINTLVSAIAICVLTAPAPKAQKVFEIVHAFGLATDGNRPQTAVIQARDGDFYGTTQSAGRFGLGVIYGLSPDGTETVLHTFSSTSQEGGSPSGLIEATDGSFYGTANSGYRGFIFRMEADGTFTTVRRLVCSEGGPLAGALLQGDDGNFYGMSSGWIDHDECVAPATVFRMTPDGTVSSLHWFIAPVDGTTPNGPLIQGRDGHLYGTATTGGPFGGGTVFRITMDGTLTVLHAFHDPDDAGEGSAPRATLVQAADGAFYGTTSRGGLCDGCGTIFRVSAGGVFDVMYAFRDGSDTGTAPVAPLVEARDGNLYGTTSVYGSVFRMTPGGDLTVVHALDGDADGYNLYAPLLEASGVVA